MLLSGFIGRSCTYINALEALFIVERVEPWTKVDYQRVGRQDKLFICDSGLVCSLLRWGMDQVLLDSDRIGKIFENFIFNELMTHINASNGEYSLYHYRDREQREVDFIIERDDGAVLGIEVKAGATVGRADFKHLAWLQNKVAERSFIGIVLYTGTEILPFGDKLWAVPISCLWQGEPIKAL
jgi:predicted AAA+ superfamily ATPase